MSTISGDEIIIIVEGGRKDGLMARMEVGEIVKKVKGLFERNGENGRKARVLTTSGIMAELGIDSLLDDGVFKSVPIVSVLVGIGKTAQNLHDRNLLKQTIKFINTFLQIF